MQQKKVDVWVGLFVLLGVLGLIGLVLRVGGGGGLLSQVGYYDVKADFSNVGTLKPRAPVKMSGVVIGSVGDITLVDVGGEYKAQVVMHINNGIKIPQDSGVAVNTAGLLGAQFISVTQGAEVEHPVAAGASLENTNPALGLEDLVRQFFISKTEEAASKADKSVEPTK